MAVTVDKLQQIIAPAVEALGFELYGCVLHAEMSHSTLIIYIDRPEGVNCDDCAKISRQVGALLDVEDLISGRYSLEVSSPGIDRPLFRLPHYERVVGESVKLRLRQAQDNKRNLTGVLKAVAGDQITLLLDDGSELVLDFAEIDKAKLVSDL